MSAEFFLDTNILICSFDLSMPRKRATARKLIRKSLDEGIGWISWQVVQEFLNAALHKFEEPLTSGEATDYLDNVLLPMCRVSPSPSLYADALRIHRETQYRFYDCLIVASAIQIGVPTLYSEDLQSGRSIAGLQIVNPFAIS